MFLCLIIDDGLVVEIGPGRAVYALCEAEPPG
jgi:hypothetical protein